MKALITIIIVALVGVGAYFAFRSDGENGNAPQNGSDMREYSNSNIGLEFDYRTGPDGYVLTERTSSDQSVNMIHSITLTRAEDAAQEPPIGGEGPPTITIQVFENVRNQQSRMWADANPQYSNINLATGPITDTVVGGANSIRYMADGLYASENVVVAHGENIYVITGNFLDAESQIRKDFAPLIESVRFIPQPGQE